jgi:hypothetical protein
MRWRAETVVTSEHATVADLVAYFVQNEHWRRVMGFECYEVSSWGNVRRAGRILAPAFTRGYPHVTLCTRGVAVNKRIHTLVAEAFLGPPPFVDAIIAHIDGDPTNGKVSNMRWATATDNQRDRNRHGTRIRGREVFGAKLDDTQIPTIRAAICTGARYAEIADKFGVSISTISLIKRDRIWRHA